MRLPTPQEFHFDVDDYLNALVLPSQLHRLPAPLSRFLGYRKTPAREVGNLLIAWWSFVGALAGLCLVAGVFNYSPIIQIYNPPVLVASFGATAILEYNVIQSPLAQPRNSLLGHGLAAIVGVAITKLFMLNPSFDSITWVAGAVGCGLASSVMGLTNTVHPPGGATALLSAVDPTVRGMGWHFVPLVVLGSLLMLVAGMIVNNIQRQFPTFWWTPRHVGPNRTSDIETQADGHGPAEKNGSGAHDSNTCCAIIITEDGIRLPRGLSLGPEEAGVLEILGERLRGIQSQRNGSMTSISECTPVRNRDDGSQSSMCKEWD